MEKCPNCGIDFNNTLGYCPSCGTKVTKKKTEPPKPQVRVIESVLPKQVQCAYCGTMVDSRLTSCPSCGATIEKFVTKPNAGYTQDSISNKSTIDVEQAGNESEIIAIATIITVVIISFFLAVL